MVRQTLYVKLQVTMKLQMKLWISEDEKETAGEIMKLCR